MDVFDLVAKITLDSSEYEQGLESAEQSAGSFGQKIKGGIGKAAKVGAGAVLAIGAASTAASVAFVKGAGNVAAYGDNIDKMSQKMGMSSDTYQEWDAVMRHSGTSMETMQASMKTLASAVETGSDAFDKLGLSQEQISKMSQEELFETTITALQGVEDETERTYLAGKLLGRGATELGALLNTSADDTAKMRKRVHELGGVMDKRGVKAAARYQDSLQDMNTAISGIGRNLMTTMLPSMATVMDGITEIFAGDSDKGIGMIASGIDSLIDNIGQKMPKVIEIGSKLMTAFGKVLSDNLPKIITAAVNFIATSLPGLVQGLLTIALPAIITLVKSIATAMPGMLKGIWDAIKASAPTLLATIGSLVSQIPSALGGILSAIGGWIASNAASFAEKGGEILGKIKDGIVNTIGNIVEGFASLISTIAGWVSSHSGDLLAVGQNVLSWIIAGIKAFIGNIVNGIKDMISKFTGWVSDHSGEILSVGTSILDWIISGIADFIGNVVDGFANFMSTLWSWIQGIGTAIKNIGKTVVERVKDGIKNKITSVKDAFTGLLGAIREKITGMKEGLKGIGGKIVDGIKAGITGVKAIAEKIGDVIKGAIDSATSKTYNANVKIAAQTGYKPGGADTDERGQAKARLKPYLFSRATVFGKYGGDDLVAGEAGPEMLLGVNKLNAMLFQSVQGGMQSMMSQIYDMMSGMQTGGGNSMLEAQILGVPNRYLPGIADRQIVLDTGAIAGAVAPGVNAALGMQVGDRRRYNA